MIAAGGEEGHVWIFGGAKQGTGWKRTAVLDRSKARDSTLPPPSPFALALC